MVLEYNIYSVQKHQIELTSCWINTFKVRCSRGLAALFMIKHSDYQPKYAGFNFSIADAENYEDD